MTADAEQDVITCDVHHGTNTGVETLFFSMIRCNGSSVEHFLSHQTAEATACVNSSHVVLCADLFTRDVYIRTCTDVSLVLREQFSCVYTTTCVRMIVQTVSCRE